MSKQRWQYAADDFLSSVLQRAVWTVKAPELIDAAAAQELQDWLATAEAQFVSIKTAADDQSAATHLRELGFIMMDDLVTFAKERAAHPESIPPAGYAFRWAQAADEPAVVELASRAFRCSRFHNDPAFSSEEADAVKGAWAANYFSGRRGAGMAVVTADEHAIGFLLLVHTNKVLVLDLLAVDERHRGQGLGRGLVEWAETTWSATPVTSLEVGTQRRNEPALALYRKIGFQETHRQTVWHWHVPK